MSFNLERHWYRKSYTGLTILLLPLSYLFSVIVSFRRFLYRIGMKKTVQFPIPIIVVGNIAVGGTGKTPLVIWLAKWLQAQGFRPGIVSRGAGGSKQYLPHLVELESDPQVVGDESLLLAKQTHCPVVICIDRVAAVKEIMETTQCNIVISDDGLQHYRMGRTMEIVIVDGERQFGNGCLLPAGPLREPITRLKEVDCVVTHGEAGEITMQLSGDMLHSILNNEKRPIQSLAHQSIHAVAGIGHPQRFFSLLRSYGLQVIEHAFPDHYHYQKRDFEFPDAKFILMTEKDAVKCKNIADERFWYLPVEAKVDQKLEECLRKKISFP